MNNRRRRRRQRRKGKRGKSGLDGLEGMSPKEMQKALGQIDTNEIGDVEEVIVRTKDEDIILENPEVTVMNMGQEVWNVVPQGTKRSKSKSSSSTAEPEETESKEVKIKEEDVELIMNTADVSREDAENAIKQNDGDVAAAIMSLK